MRRPPGSPRHWPRHAIMIVVSFLMLIPFYWVLKTSLTGENIYAWPPRIIPVDPHLFNYVDVWYLIPFGRYLLNSVIVTAMAIAGSLLFNVAAGYALTRHFPGRRWIVKSSEAWPPVTPSEWISRRRCRFSFKRTGRSRFATVTASVVVAVASAGINR